MKKVIAILFLVTIFMATSVFADGGVVSLDGGVVSLDGGVVSIAKTLIFALTGGVVS